MVTKDITPDSNVEIETADESALPELVSSASRADQAQVSTMEIDLPDDVADEVILPDMNNFDLDMENELLAADIIETEVKNSILISIDDPTKLDFTKEMSKEQGVDHDLELELENLSFLDEQAVSTSKTNVKNRRSNRNWSKSRNKESKDNDTTVMPDKIGEKQRDTSPSEVQGSPKGVWKTTCHGIQKNYGPAHPQNYGCKVCGQLLPSRGELNEHYRMNHLLVLCPVCKKSFSCPNTCNRHLYLHNLNKRHVCDKCKESFTFKSELATHGIIHRTLKTWICAKKGCEHDFKRKSNLAAHAKTHSGQVYVCTICNNFSTKIEKNLKSHIQSHTKELKFKCRICGKGFSWTQLVKRHMEEEHS